MDSMYTCEHMGKTMTLILECICTLTKPESCQSTHVSPGQWGQWSPVFYHGEGEDERHTGDKDEIEEAHGGKEVSHFSKVGAAQEHLEQHLDGEETSGNLHHSLDKYLKSVQRQSRKWYNL